jgi:hypothetical protein
MGGGGGGRWPVDASAVAPSRSTARVAASMHWAVPIAWAKRYTGELLLKLRWPLALLLQLRYIVPQICIAL